MQPPPPARAARSCARARGWTRTMTGAVQATCRAMSLEASYEASFEEESVSDESVRCARRERRHAARASADENDKTLHAPVIAWA